jgi:hypothetical protein
MISVLVVAKPGEDLASLEGQDPSVEVLLAQGLEEALEKLARNRRIDAVLLLAGEETASILEAIQEDSPAHPPIFVPVGSGPVLRGVQTLPGHGAQELLNLLKQKLET